jgi:hypothetical protein
MHRVMSDEDGVASHRFMVWQLATRNSQKLRTFPTMLRILVPGSKNGESGHSPVSRTGHVRPMSF